MPQQIGDSHGAKLFVKINLTECDSIFMYFSEEVTAVKSVTTLNSHLNLSLNLSCDFVSLFFVFFLNELLLVDELFPHRNKVYLP